jgi:DNA-binding SARP family transcriptional activator/tetratricopeptide (TPR) repeat protein
MQFRVLGALEVEGAGGVAAVGGLRQRQLLLRFLVAEGAVLPADVLLDDVWPAGAIDEQVVKTAVHRLRRFLTVAGLPNRALAHVGLGYRLQVDPALVDATRFRALCAEGHRLRVDDPRSAASRLAEALSLWRGRPYADADGLPFSATPAAELDEARLTAEEDRAEARLALGMAHEVAADLEALVRAHPLRERLAATMVVAQYCAGRPADALATYRRLERSLGSELGTLPSPALRALESAVLRHDSGSIRPLERPAEPARVSNALRNRRPTAPVPVRVEGHPFVGRAEELAGLIAALDGLGGLDIRAVSGPAGIGKTRLAHELACAAARRGVAVLYGRSDPDGLGAMNPFVEAVRPLLAGGAGGPLGEHQERIAHQLAPLIPAVAGSDGGGEDPQTRFRRLLDGFADAIGVVAADGPTLLLLDDLHWADAATMSTIRHVTDQLGPAPLLAVLLHRADDVVGSPIQNLLTDLDRVHGIRRQALAGLDSNAVGQFVEAVAPSAWSGRQDEFVDRLLALSGGNPFLLGELLAMLARERGAAAEPSDLDGLSVPDLASEVLERALDDEPDGLVRALTIASVIGSEFDCDLLAATANVGDDDLCEWLDRAARKGIVAEQRELPDRYRFAHELLRRSLYDRMTDSWRRRIHKAVAGALKSRPDAPPSEVAHHLVAAVPVVPRRAAIDAARDAGDALADSGAFDAAARWYRTALALVEQDENATPAEVGGLILAEARALGSAGHPLESQARIDAVVELAHAHHLPALLADAVVALRMFGTPWAGRQLEVERVQEALGAVDADDWNRRGQLLCVLAAQLIYGGRVVDAAPIAQEAIHCAERSGDATLLVHALACDHHHLVNSLAPLDRRRCVSERAIALALAHGNGLARLIAWRSVMSDRLTAGDLDGAEAARVECEKLCERYRQPNDMWHARLAKASLALAHGHLGDAAPLIADAKEYGMQLGVENAEGCGDVQTFLLMWDLGRLGELEPLIEHLARTRPNAKSWRTALVLVQTFAGHEEPARDSLRALTADGFALERDWLWLVQIVVLAESAWLLGDADAAAALYALLHPFESQTVTMPVGNGVVGFVEHFLGVLADVVGDECTAQHHLENARRNSVRADMPVWAGRATLALATIAARHHWHADIDAITRDVVAVREDALGRGAGLLVGRADRLLATIGSSNRR